MMLYCVFNLGTILRSAFDLFSHLGPIYYRLTMVGMILQMVGIFYFVYLIANRIRAPLSR